MRSIFRFVTKCPYFYLTRIRRVVILWDKMTTFEGAHHVLKNSAAGRQIAAPLFPVFLSSARFSTSGKPAFDLFNFDTWK